MFYPKPEIAVVIAIALSLPGCNRTQNASETSSADASRTSIANAQRDRDQDVNRLQAHLNDLDQKWADKEKKLVEQRAAASAAMRADVKQDLQNAREAVANLKTTTAENWWEREEDVLVRTTAELEGDVQRFPRLRKAPTTAGKDSQAAAHETSFVARRDAFVTQLQARVDAIKQDLDSVKATGTKKTELNDTRARVKKLDEDLAELHNASPDDWWKISKKRVSDYVDRVDRSVSRLDDNKG